MFSWRSLWLIFLLQAGAALEYPELYTHAARMGSSTTIPCKFNVDAIPPARRSFTILWHFQEKEIFRSPNALKAADPRLSIDQDRIQDGIADLSMSRVSISDGGLYICSMVQIPEKKVVKEIRLDIHAPPQITITNKTALINIESALRCAISGFYPVDIDIKWLRDGEMLNNVIMEIPQRGPDGTYSVRSSVRITPTEEDRKRTFSYRIQHESLTAPLQEDFRLVFGDEERTKQNLLLIIIIISVCVTVGVVILIVIIITIKWCKKRGGRRKGAETAEDQKTSLVSGVISDNVRQPPDPITNTNEEFTRKRQHGSLEEESRPRMAGTNPATTSESPDSAIRGSGDVRETQHSIHNTNKSFTSNQQPEPREKPNHSQTTATRSADTTGGRRSEQEAENQDNENQKLFSGDESGDVRQPRDSIHNKNKTSIMNPQPGPREKPNHSQMAKTKPAVHPKTPDRTVSSPGVVGGTRDSINDTNKRLTSNQQAEPRQGRNQSRMTATRSAVPLKSPDSVYSPGDVRGTQHSFNNANKRLTSNQQPEPRQGRNHSRMTATRSAVPLKSPDSVYSPGNPSLENQWSGRHQTMTEDQETEASANNQDEEIDCSKGNVKNRIAMYENIK